MNKNITDSQAISWKTDQYGTSILKFSNKSYVWIQGRQPYCDRGHWEWGSMGFDYRGDEPSYYFMTQERAREQVERWLGSRLGIELPPPDNSMPTDGQLFTHSTGAESSWHWEHLDSGLMAVAGDTRIELLLDEDDHSKVIAHAHGIEGLDDSDRFPRNYIGLAAAINEVESFLAWRLHKVPQQIPGPLTHPPLSPVLLPSNPPLPHPGSRGSLSP